jgi:hypothetical protein
MVDLWARRDVVGHALAAGAAVSTSAAGRGEKPSSGLGSSGTSVGTAFVALFTDARGSSFPDSCQGVQTQGHSVLGIGAAFYRRDATVDGRYVGAHQRTSFLDAKGQGFRLVTRSLDVQQAGALGDGKADDTKACQEALDVVEAAGGGTVLLPAGEYRISSPLILPPRVGLQGCGQASTLRAQGCDGLDIAASDVIAPRQVRDLGIRGDQAGEASAIRCDLADGKRVQGLVFERLYLSFFKIGINGHGFWHTTFRTVSMHHVWQGFVFRDRNIKITIDDCRVTHGGLVKGEGVSIGLQVGDGASAFRPEDVQVERTIIYGFDTAILWRTALFGGVKGCDLDACTKTGLELVTADGGFTFRDNWVQVDGAAVYGIHCVALGYKPEVTNISIVNNRVNCNSASGDSYGIAIRNQQANISCRDNSITGAFQSGFYSDGVQHLVIDGNKISGRLSVERCSDVALRDNFIAGGMALKHNARLSCGAGAGKQSGRLVGDLTLPKGATRQSASFEALGLPDLPDGEYRLAVSLHEPSSPDRHSVHARVTRADIQLVTDRPLMASTTVTFRIDVY